MKKLVSTAAAALLIAGLSAGSASAKQKRPGMHSTTKSQGMTTGRSVTGGNAAMSGNNGNSASGSNSIPNVKGGNAGGMR
ncbi:MAG: hypothetical protein Q7T81_16945 [Pseudolabrys sp.]|nr:hypothetical protein [Pseudolabrys sp.]